VVRRANDILPERAKRILPEQVKCPEFIRRVGELFTHLHDVGCERDKAGNRGLFFDDYCTLILLYACNPVIDSMRMLQQASELEQVQRMFGVKEFSLGSFSESPVVFDARMLQPIAIQLAAQIQPPAGDPRLKDVQYAIHLVDSTLLRTLPRLAETFYVSRKDGEDHHAWRVHLELQLGMPAPCRFEREGAHGDERKNLRRHVQPGRCYTTDRGYHDVSVFNDIHAAGSRYVCRAKDNLVYTVVANLPLTEEDRAAGVLSDQIVLIGQDREQPPTHAVRLVEVRAEVHPKRTRKGMQPSSGRMMFVTNFSRDEACALVVSLIYAYRWTIELFFRFLKQMLGLRHLLSHRPEAVDILLYCMVIACLLLYLWTGHQPDKATLFKLSMYLLGVASLEELTAHLEKARQKREQSKSKKSA
jgi:hypothetical protein